MMLLSYCFSSCGGSSTLVLVQFGSVLDATWQLWMLDDLQCKSCCLFPSLTHMHNHPLLTTKSTMDAVPLKLPANLPLVDDRSQLQTTKKERGSELRKCEKGDRIRDEFRPCSLLSPLGFRCSLTVSSAWVFFSSPSCMLFLVCLMTPGGLARQNKSHSPAKSGLWMKHMLSQQSPRHIFVSRPVQKLSVYLGEVGNLTNSIVATLQCCSI